MSATTTTATRQTVASYTWHDLATADGLIGRETFHFADADPGDLPFDSLTVNKASKRNGVGALMGWCQSTDDEGGTLIMLTGQTREQERFVMDNVGWMTSCGAVYSIARCGDKGWKTLFDHRIKINGYLWRIWMIPNDRHVRGYR